MLSRSHLTELVICTIKVKSWSLALASATCARLLYVSIIQQVQAKSAKMFSSFFFFMSVFVGHF